MKKDTPPVTRAELEAALAQLAGSRSNNSMRDNSARGFETKDLQASFSVDRKDRQEITIPNALVEARNRLIDQGVNKQLVSTLITTCGNTQSFYTLKDPTRVSNHIKYQLEGHIRTLKEDPAIHASKANKTVVCVIGLSGSGKTSTLAKLAAYYMKTLGKSVAWISADTIRTGAISLAQTYTQSLNIPLYLAYTPQDLEKAVQDENSEIIMLDTSARNPYQENEIVEIGSFLTKLSKKVVYLTAPATAKEKDLRQAWGAYSPFDVAGFIVTKLDETNYYGDVINLAWRTQAPLAYFTFGTQILDHLTAADAKKCAGLVLGERILR